MERPRVEVRLEEDDEAAVAGKLARGGEGRRELGRDGARSRRRGGRRRPRRWSSSRRPAPRKPASALGRGVPVEARQLERRQRARGVQPVVRPGHGEVESTGSSVPAPDDVAPGRPAAQPLEAPLELGGRGERGVVVELDVRHDRDLRRQPEHRAVGLVALDDEPAARPSARCRRAAGPRPRSRNEGSSPSAVEQKAIIAAVVVFPCAPATTIERRRRDELGEELRAAAGPRTRPA